MKAVYKLILALCVSVAMKFDDILVDIGEFGWYQKRVYCLAAAPTILVAFETLSVIFIFYIPDHRYAGLLTLWDGAVLLGRLALPFPNQYTSCFHSL